MQLSVLRGCPTFYCRLTLEVVVWHSKVVNGKAKRMILMNQIKSSWGRRALIKQPSVLGISDGSSSYDFSCIENEDFPEHHNYRSMLLVNHMNKHANFLRGRSISTTITGFGAGIWEEAVLQAWHGDEEETEADKLHPTPFNLVPLLILNITRLNTHIPTSHLYVLHLYVFLNPHFLPGCFQHRLRFHLRLPCPCRHPQPLSQQSTSPENRPHPSLSSQRHDEDH